MDPNDAISSRISLPEHIRDPAIVFMSEVIDHSNFHAGRYSYYHDRSIPEDYAAKLAPYLFEGAPEHVRIGRFCQLAEGVEFITSSANHEIGGVSTYPLIVLDPERATTYVPKLPPARDTVVGHDCWLGRGVTVMPGVTLGNGVIAGARAVVTEDVPDFAIVAGNPARVIRSRFSPDTVGRLNAIAWWDWTPDRIAAALPIFEAGDIDALEHS